MGMFEPVTISLSLPLISWVCFVICFVMILIKSFKSHEGGEKNENINS